MMSSSCKTMSSCHALRWTSSQKPALLFWGFSPDSGTNSQCLHQERRPINCAGRLTVISGVENDDDQGRSGKY